MIGIIPKEIRIVLGVNPAGARKDNAALRESDAGARTAIGGANRSRQRPRTDPRQTGTAPAETRGGQSARQGDGSRRAIDCEWHRQRCACVVIALDDEVRACIAAAFRAAIRCDRPTLGRGTGHELQLIGGRRAGR